MASPESVSLTVRAVNAREREVARRIVRARAVDAIGALGAAEFERMRAAQPAYVLIETERVLKIYDIAEIAQRAKRRVSRRPKRWKDARVAGSVRQIGRETKRRRIEAVREGQRPIAEARSAAVQMDDHARRHRPDVIQHERAGSLRLTRIWLRSGNRAGERPGVRAVVEILNQAPVNQMLLRRL